MLSKQVPERVQGFVDSELSRTLTVTLGVASPAENSLPRFEVRPSEVQATAPSRVLNQVTRVVTSPVDLDPGEEREAPLIALDSRGRVVEPVTLHPASVSVQRLDTGTLPVKTLPVVLGAPPASLRVQSQTLQPRTVRVVAAPNCWGACARSAVRWTTGWAAPPCPSRCGCPTGHRRSRPSASALSSSGSRPRPRRGSAHPAKVGGVVEQWWELSKAS
ncbi:YbbR-like domain-containing protein [Deinococcus radiodurans]|nr:YbbR-like domain-containing protein [Deinococcus radiodurans]